MSCKTIPLICIGGVINIFTKEQLNNIYYFRMIFYDENIQLLFNKNDMIKLFSAYFAHKPILIKKKVNYIYYTQLFKHFFGDNYQEYVDEYLIKDCCRYDSDFECKKDLLDMCVNKEY